jgi:hypothetical protein
MHVIDLGDVVGLTVFGIMVAVLAAGFAYHYADAAWVPATIAAVAAVLGVWMLMRHDPLDRWLGMTAVALPWAIAGALVGVLGARRDAA